MDVDRIRKVADMIEANPEHFDMSGWIQGPAISFDRRPLPVSIAASDLFACRTTACIGGWACNLWGAEVKPHATVASNAARILGLPEDDADDLFYSAEIETAELAAAHLRGMADDYEAASA